ncbi:MAG: ribosome assembly cofactor RimP [Ginsengibacter sp.]
MGVGTLQKNIEDYINTLLEKSEDVFLVEVKVNPGNNIIVFLDADSGVTIDTCLLINKALYKQIEEDALFPNGDFALEVSSPGVDEPLKLHRQFKKNIGRTVEVILNDATKKQGKLTEVNDDEITIEEAEGKTKKAHSHGNKDTQVINKKTNILFNQIKHAKVLVTF